MGNLIAFKDFSIKRGILASPFATPLFRHFLYFFKSPYFGELLSNTLVISLSKLALNTFCSIALALMLSETRSQRFKKTVQTITYLPYFLSWVIVYGIVTALFSQTNGLVNLLLKRAFGYTIPALTSPKDFFWTILLSSAWKGTGWGAIIYLAAISGIDPTLYEAATIDGANRVQTLWHVTVSGIRGTIVVLLILNTGHILDAGFDQIFVMYSVPVYSVADIIDTWVYRTGLEQLNFSLSTAVSLFKTAISFALILGVNTLAKRWDEGLW